MPLPTPSPQTPAQTPDPSPARQLQVTDLAPLAGVQGAPTLLLAHGYGCSQAMWSGVVPLLPATRRVLFDFPGAGRADPDAYDPVQHATLDGYAVSLLQLMDELDLRDVVYVGHSVGAMIGALAAVRAPERFRSLVMLSPSPCYANHPPDYAGGFDAAQLDGLLQSLADGHVAWSRALAPVIMGNSERPALAGELAESFCAVDPSIAQRWAQATFLSDLRSLVPRVQTPCLVLQCREDAIAPESVGHWLHQHLPHSSLVLLQATGHCPHVSHPGEVARVIEQHLAMA
jgi:sigma-B regulation protein RsbQ